MENFLLVPRICDNFAQVREHLDKLFVKYNNGGYFSTNRVFVIYLLLLFSVDC